MKQILMQMRSLMSIFTVKIGIPGIIENGKKDTAGEMKEVYKRMGENK